MIKKTVALPSTPPKIDWSNREEVIKLLETDGRVLTAGEKKLLDGQRQINGRFFEAISTLLELMSPAKGHSAKAAKIRARSLAALKDSFKTVPGDGPPGCETGTKGAQGPPDGPQ
jgi:hypothetical protein